MDGSGVSYTCHIINDVIDSIISSRSFINGCIAQLENLSSDDFEKLIPDIIDDLRDSYSDLDSVDSRMEEIREANNTLRSWGSNRDDEAIELETENSTLKEELDERVEEIEKLEKEIGDLEDKFLV